MVLDPRIVPVWSCDSSSLWCPPILLLCLLLKRERFDTYSLAYNCQVCYFSCWTTVLDYSLKKENPEIK